MVNQVVSRYYKLPPNSQTTKKVLELINDHWSAIEVRQFESKIHYYKTLANITDQLLQCLTTERIENPPLFLYEKFNMNMDELGTELSLTFEVAEWSGNSFIIKKYLVDTDEEMNLLFNNMISVFCVKAFGQLPERIEIYSLMEGKRNIYTDQEGCFWWIGIPQHDQESFTRTQKVFENGFFSSLQKLFTPKKML